MNFFLWHKNKSQASQFANYAISLKFFQICIFFDIFELTGIKNLYYSFNFQI